MEHHIQRYTKYIHEALQKVDIGTATYKEHLHKVFEWYGCIELSRESGRVVLCWEDIPPGQREEKNMARDMGIDAWDRDGDCVIQMKLYNGCIGWRSFSTFWSACYSLFEDSTKILYRNAESGIHSLIQANIQKGKLLDRTVTDAEFRSACQKIQKQKIRAAPPVVDDVVIRPYQQEAIVMMEKARDEGKNLMVCLPTGTGKTVVTLRYHLAHLVPLGVRLLILVPTLVLMEQWKGKCEKVGVETYLIGTNQHRSLDEYVDQSVVICVYDSFSGIAGEVEQFGRIVIDEAHHVLVPERYMETEQEFTESGSDEDEEEWDEEEEEEWEVEEEEKGKKGKEEKPVSYMSHIRSLSQTQRVVYLSATIDKPEDGSLFYEYKVRQAIQDGYLCDYQFVFPIFEQAYETNQHLAEYLVHQQQETHCLIYASNRAEGKEFVERLNTLQSGCAGYVDGTTRPASRKKLFREFEEGKIRFLVNIRVLVEGFDAPHIRSVFFLHVSSNDIFIIQAIGRALRLHADKVKASIYVPFTHEGDIDRIQAFLSQLATYDERVGQSIKEKRVGGYVRLERGEAEDTGDREEDGEEDEKGEEKEEVFEFRYNLVVDRMGMSGKLEEMALRRAEEYIALYHELGHRPKSCLHGKTKKEKELATEEQKKEHHISTWFGRMKIAKQGRGDCKVYSSVEKLLSDIFGEEWWKNRDVERNQLKMVHEYIIWVNEHLRKPSMCLKAKKKDNATEEQKTEHRHAEWMTTIKMVKKGATRRGKLYPSVEEQLIKTFGKEWYEEEISEKKQLDMANNYISWVHNHGIHPINHRRTKIIETQEQKKESQYYKWMSHMKQSKRGHGSITLYPLVEKLISNTFGEGWWEKKNQEHNQLEIADGYIQWVTKYNRQPSTVLRTKKNIENITEETKKEHKYAHWIHNMKHAKRGQNKQRLYPSVEQRLIEAFGIDWYRIKI